MPSSKAATLNSLAEQIKQLASTTGEIHTALYGKPPENVGMVVEVDRLKQAESKRTWHIRMLWTAVTGAFLGTHWR
jgi:hypothetical protein